MGALWRLARSRAHRPTAGQRAHGQGPLLLRAAIVKLAGSLLGRLALPAGEAWLHAENSILKIELSSLRVIELSQHIALFLHRLWVVSEPRSMLREGAATPARRASVRPLPRIARSSCP